MSAKATALLAAFLRGLGFPESAVAVGLEERSALFRSAVADRESGSCWTTPETAARSDRCFRPVPGAGSW